MENLQNAGDWISNNFEKIFAGLVTACLKIYVSDVTGYVLLWLLVITLFTALRRSEQKQEKIRAIHDQETERRLQDCVQKHADSDRHIDSLEEKHNKLRNKYTIILGMLSANMGRRALPTDFWKQLLDENSPVPPDFLTHFQDSEGGG